jgi:hypothetical protein
MVKTSTIFSPFQLVHGVESILLIECEIPSLKLEIELLPDTSEFLDENHQDASIAIKTNKQCVKVQYNTLFYPRQYVEGDLVLLYDQAKEPLGACKFNHMSHGLYIVQRVLEKGVYELEDY